MDRLQVVDCYTDPLGWNKVGDARNEDDSDRADLAAQSFICHDVTNLTDLLASVLQSGQGN